MGAQNRQTSVSFVNEPDQCYYFQFKDFRIVNGVAVPRNMIIEKWRYYGPSQSPQNLPGHEYTNDVHNVLDDERPNLFNEKYEFNVTSARVNEPLEDDAFLKNMFQDVQTDDSRVIYETLQNMR